MIHNDLVVLTSGDVGAYDHVCGGQQRAAKDELHEDGGLLAGLQPFHSFRRGSSSCVYGEKNVSPFCRFFIKEKVNGEDYDIKINRITVGSTAENKVTALRVRWGWVVVTPMLSHLVICIMTPK